MKNQIIFEDGNISVLWAPVCGCNAVGWLHVDRMHDGAFRQYRFSDVPFIAFKKIKESSDALGFFQSYILGWYEGGVVHRGENGKLRPMWEVELFWSSEEIGHTPEMAFNMMRGIKENVDGTQD